MDQPAIIFTISDLAREFKITPRTIRFWEDQGILAPLREGSKRVFTRRDRARLKWLCAANDLDCRWPKSRT